MADPGARYILIIDDDHAGLLALSEALRIRLDNITVHTASTAENGLSRLETVEYDLVICDVRLPGMDGLSVLKEVQARRPDTPVVIVTAGALEREEQALYGGAYAFIEKPLQISHFISVVEHALDRTDLARRVKEENAKSVSRLGAHGGLLSR